MDTARTTTDRRRRAAHRARKWIPRVFTILTLLALAAPAFGQRRERDRVWERDERVSGSLVEVQVLVEGRRAPLYVGRGMDDRRYFEAFRGKRYALRIRNRTGGRIGVLLAVDGLNVVNGERTALRNSEPMYVLDARESATIRGWRTSLSHVREFVFVDETRSYANRTDQANADMGWIRVLAFREEPVVSWYRDSEPLVRRDRGGRGPDSGALDAAKPGPGSEERERQEQAPVGKSAPESAAEPRSLEEKSRDARSLDESFPGTGWGDSRRDRVRRVHFDPVQVAGDHIVLRYEYASGLVALGIFPERDRLHERDRGELSFAPPPRW